MSNKNKNDLRRRNFISLEAKIRVLDRLKKGDKVARIAKSLNLNEATIRTIRKNEQKIRTAVSAGSAISAKVAARTRQIIIEKMEKALIIWINNSCEKQIPIDGNVIKRKAIQIYNHLKERGESPVKPGFVASYSWLERFKKRFALPNIKRHRKNVLVATENVTEYLEEFQKVIEDNGYTPYQVFNADEFSLCWRTIPMKIPDEQIEETDSNLKADDRVTLLMCSNASGDCMIKPMVVYRTGSPRELDGVDKERLPVFWKAKRSWVTVDSFKQWFANCFLPDVEKYLKQRNLSFKILLLLDDAPCHPRDISHPNVEIRFLASNSSIQPLDQGIISTFKCYYIKNFLQWILEKVDSKSIEAVQPWKHFSITDSIEMLASSLHELKPSTLNACWRNLWPESVLSESTVEPIENEISGILEIARSIGECFSNTTSKCIQEFLLEKESDERDMLDIESESSEIDSNECSRDEKLGDSGFTITSIRKGLHIAEQLEYFFINADPSTERSIRFIKEFQKSLAPYRKIYEDLLNKSN